MKQLSTKLLVLEKAEKLMLVSELEKTISNLKHHANNLKRGLDLFRNIEFPLTIKES